MVNIESNDDSLLLEVQRFKTNAFSRTYTLLELLINRTLSDCHSGMQQYVVYINVIKYYILALMRLKYYILALCY